MRKTIIALGFISFIMPHIAAAQWVPFPGWGTVPTWGNPPTWGSTTPPEKPPYYPKVLIDGRVQTCVTNTGMCGPKCAGDCNRDCVVTPSEVALCKLIMEQPKSYPYNILCGYFKDAYGKEWVSMCDPSNDGRITSTDLSCMRNNQTNGCRLSINNW